MRKHGHCCRTVSVHPSLPSRSCIVSIQVAEDNIKLLSRPGRPIILVFDPSPGTQFQGETFKQGCKMRIIFNWNCHLSQKRYEIAPWLLQNINRKSQMGDRSASVLMTMSNLERRVASTQFFQAISLIMLPKTGQPQHSNFVVPSIYAYTF